VRRIPARVVKRRLYMRPISLPISDSGSLPRAGGLRLQGRELIRDEDSTCNKAIKRANRQLDGDGQTPLPEGLTLHALRRTCASVLVALGKDPRAT